MGKRDAEEPATAFVPFDVELPPACLVCGTKKKLTAHPRLGPDDIHPTAYGGLAGMLAANLFVLGMRLARGRQLSVTLQHYRCSRCDKQIREAGSMGLVPLIGPFVALLFGMIAWFASTPLWGCIVGIATFIVVVGVSFLARGAPPVVVVTVEANGVVLSGLRPRAAAAIAATTVTRADGNGAT